MSEVLCYDKPSGRYFKCTEAKLHERISELNKHLFDLGYVSAREVCDALFADLPKEQFIPTTDCLELFDGVHVYAFDAKPTVGIDGVNFWVVDHIPL